METVDPNANLEGHNCHWLNGIESEDMAIMGAWFYTPPITGLDALSGIECLH